MIAVLGGLGAAVAWAISTVSSSRSSKLIDPASVVAWVMLVGIVITAPLALADGVPRALTHEAGAWLLVSGMGNVGGLLLTYAAMRVGQVALVAPLVSAEGAIAAVIAVIAGEAISPGVGVTLVAIVVGVAVASLNPAERPDAQPSHHPRSVLLALSAACMFGLSLYATGRAGASLPVAWVVLSARLIGTILLALPLIAARRLRLTRRAAPLVVASGACEVLGFYSYTTGARHGIAIAAVLGSQFGALASIAGYCLFAERLTRVQVGGIVLLVVAVAVLSALRA